MKLRIFTLLSLLSLPLVNFAKVQLGSAGNAFTVLNHNMHSISVDPVTGAIMFIHRNDPAAVGGAGTVAQYRYDLSSDGGQTFVINKGPLNPLADNSSIQCRYPQVWIHSGATTIPNLYFNYLGTYHNNGDWDGVTKGTGKLDHTSYNEDNTMINNGDVALFYSLCKGAQTASTTTYWAIAEDDTYNGASTPSTFNNRYVVMKGTYDNATNLITWAADKFLTIPTQDPSNPQALTPNIAFDPSGQKGWITTLADVRSTNDPNTDSVYAPVMWKTTDGGATWVGPYDVDLLHFPVLMDVYFAGAPPFTATNGDVFHALSTAFESDLAVDKDGNPHMTIDVGFGPSEANITAGQGYTVRASNKFDISYDQNLNKFVFYFITQVQQLRDTIGLTQSSSGSTIPATQDQRTQVSVTPNGDKVFYSWVDNDDTVDAGVDRTLFVRGLDFDNIKGTGVFSLTDTANGNHARLHTVSPLLLRDAADTATIVPLAITKLNTDNTLESAASFLYYGMGIGDSEFSINIQKDTMDIVAVPLSNGWPISISNVNNTLKNVNVYPNPTVNQLNITNLQAEKSTISLCDVTGKIYFRQVVKGDSKTIDMSGLAKGNYILYIDNAIGSLGQKVTKQ